MTTLKKLGIVVSRLDNSEFGLLVSDLVNKLIKSSDIDIIVFREQVSLLPQKIDFSIMQLHELWSFDGVCISTDLLTTQYLLSAPCPKSKYFYIWNLEWLYTDKLVYENVADLYLNKDINLLCRSESHFNVISNAWKTPTGILEDFDNEQFKRIFAIN